MKKSLAGALFLAILCAVGDARALPAEGTVGPQNASDGTKLEFRLGHEKQLIVGENQARYYEATSRAQLFSISTAVAGTTIVAANNTPVAAAAATILTLYNPLGSGKNLEVIKVYANWLSGTPAAGGLVFNYNFNQTISAAQNATPVANLVSGTSSVAKGYTQTALTGGVGVQILLRPLAYCTPFAGVISITNGWNLNCLDEVEGGIVIPPGGILSIASGGTGTTAIVNASITYREATP